MGIITSTQNSKVKHLVSLKKEGRRKKEGLIIIEGQKEIKRAMEAGIELVEYYFCREFIKNKKDLNILSACHGIELDTGLFKKISYKDKPSGILVLAKRPNLKLEELKIKKNPLIIVLETIEKPGNLGAILRTADAVQVDAVLLCESSTDIYNPNSIRASLGAIFTVPVVTCSNDEAMTYLFKNQINIYSAGLKARVDYRKPNYKKASAVVVGAEHDGLSDFWLKEVKESIKIPMKGKVDSLNASVSVAIILYEVLRQRQF